MNKTDDRLRQSCDIAIRVCMGVKPTETVLVLSDEPCRNIGYSLWDSAKSIGAEAIFSEILPRKSNGEEPPRAISSLLEAVDVALLTTSKSLSHTDARRRASSKGVRIATLPGITDDVMIRTMNVDYYEIGNLSKRLARLLSDTKEIHVSTENGTDIILDVEGREGLADTGLNHERGSFSNLPAGEAYIAPLEGRSEGKIVFDGSVAGVGLLGKDFIEVEVRKGSIFRITGGAKAELFRCLIEPFGDKGRNVAEFGIGTNPAAIITGNVLEDEKVIGTIHIAFGDNKSMGGCVSVPVHLDGVVCKPTVKLDGKIIIQEGILNL